MNLATWICTLAAIFSLSTPSWAADATPARKPALMDPVDETYSEPGTHSTKHHGKSGLGAMVTAYYDPLSSYLKLETAPAPSGFGSSSSAGMAGMQVLLTYLSTTHLELAGGFDYLFPINAQGQQNFTGQYAVNSQTLSIMGLRIAQLGYQMQMGNFTIVPYGAFGLYYGKNVVTLTTNPGQTDTVQLTKLIATFTAGVRGEIDLNDSFQLGASLEGFFPTSFLSLVSQDGGATGELPGGNEGTLRSQMDFMTSFGLRIMGSAKMTF